MKPLYSLNSHAFQCKKLALAISAALVCTPCSFADETDLALEEVLVTSQKRQEKLQDVPISVVAIDGEKLADSLINNLDSLTTHMPSIHFTETGLSTQVRVRGIGSDNSQGFEQSVGMYLDGIHFGRAQLFRTPLLDLERAELLRGPQSTIFGKNSIAGALNLTSAKPSDELEGKVSLLRELEIGKTEFNGMVSVPLSDEFGARLAVRKSDETGYIKNTTLNKEHPEKEETSLRLTLEWQATDSLNMVLKGETHRIDTTGRPVEIILDEPLQGSPTGATYAQSLAAIGQRSFDSELNYERQTDVEEFSDNEVNNVTFTLNKDIGDNTLTWVTGLLDFNYTELCDCDFVPSEIVHVELAEEYEQESHEVRFASSQDNRIEWLIGAFYQSWDQEFSDQFNMPATSLIPNQPGLEALSNTALRRDFTQSSDAMALFSKVTFKATDQLAFTLGARYTEETKSANKALNVLDLSSTTGGFASPLAGYAYLQAFSVESNQAQFDFSTGAPVPFNHSGHEVSGEREESAFTPLLNVEYSLNNDVMLYATYTTGFKAGGFDPRSNTVGTYATTDATVTETNPNLHFEFEEENLSSVEVGAKTTWADGRGELNVALFDMGYEDLQISQFDGGVGFNVGNAKETSVRGIELDGRWRLAEDLISTFGVSFLDFNYDDFKNGNCYAGQTPDGVDLDGNGSIDTCDYTDKRGVYTPEYTLNLALDYTRQLSQNLLLLAQTDIQHVAGHQVHVNLSPQGEIDAYNLLNLRLALEYHGWSFALLGQNLLDEEIISYSGNAPLSERVFGTNTFYGFVRRPRTTSLEVRYQF